MRISFALKCAKVRKNRSNLYEMIFKLFPHLNYEILNNYLKIFFKKNYSFFISYLRCCLVGRFLVADQRDSYTARFFRRSKRWRYPFGVFQPTDGNNISIAENLRSPVAFLTKALYQLAGCPFMSLMGDPVEYEAKRLIFLMI